MSVGAVRLVEIVRALSSSDPADREAGCGTITDWVSSLDKYEGRLLGMLLVMLAVIEKESSVRESELHALVELADTGGLDREGIEPIQHLNHDGLGPSESEYVEYLIEEFLGPRQSPSGNTDK